MPKRDFVDDYVRDELPIIHADKFNTLWGERDPQRRFNRTLSTPVDADMFQAAAELAIHPSLPFNGHMADLGRHIWAAGIDSLESFLPKDSKTLWSALQRIQRRISAEMYAVTAEQQVKESLEMLAVWTQAEEWNAVLDDLLFMTTALHDLPSQAWKRRIAREWATHPHFHQLIQLWEEVVPQEAPETWAKIKGAIEQMQAMVEG